MDYFRACGQWSSRTLLPTRLGLPATCICLKVSSASRKPWASLSQPKPWTNRQPRYSNKSALLTILYCLNCLSSLTLCFCRPLVPSPSLLSWHIAGLARLHFPSGERLLLKGRRLSRRLPAGMTVLIFRWFAISFTDDYVLLAWRYKFSDNQEWHWQYFQVWKCA